MSVIVVFLRPLGLRLIVGALIGGWLFGRPTINSGFFNTTGVFNLTALVVSFVGAVILLAIVNLVRRGRFR